MRTLTAERLAGIVIGFAAVGVLLTGWLVLSELFREPTCPELLGIPACFIVLAGYLLALAGAWVLDSRAGSTAFLLGTGVVIVVAIWFSAGQLSGSLECPTFEGLPMCFLSLIAGVSMLAADALRRRVGTGQSPTGA